MSYTKETCHELFEEDKDLVGGSSFLKNSLIGLRWWWSDVHEPIPGVSAP